MKVILLEKVRSLGEAGELVEVKEGYARNYLFPRGLAQEASQGNLRSLEQTQKTRRHKEDRLLQEAKTVKAKLQGKPVVLGVKAGESGRLFGSVTGKNIAEAVRKQYNVKVDKKKVELGESLRTVGEHPVEIKLHPEVSVNIIVDVRGEGRG